MQTDDQIEEKVAEIIAAAHAQGIDEEDMDELIEDELAKFGASYFK